MAEVNVSGPFFDGRADQAVRDAVLAIERAVGEEGKALVDQELPRVLKFPTGRYQSHIQVRHGGRSVVSDGGRIVYGPWLEGVGSRNFPVTRFKGYFTFRRMCVVLDARASRIADRVIRPFMNRMN